MLAILFWMNLKVALHVVMLWFLPEKHNSAFEAPPFFTYYYLGLNNLLIELNGYENTLQDWSCFQKRVVIEFSHNSF